MNKGVLGSVLALVASFLLGYRFSSYLHRPFVLNCAPIGSEAPQRHPYPKPTPIEDPAAVPSRMIGVVILYNCNQNIGILYVMHEGIEGQGSTRIKIEPRWGNLDLANYNLQIQDLLLLATQPNSSVLKYEFNNDCIIA